MRLGPIAGHRCRGANSTPERDTLASLGEMLAAAAAPRRKNAGAGMRSRSLTLLNSAAATMTTAAVRTSAPKAGTLPTAYSPTCRSMSSRLRSLVSGSFQKKKATAATPNPAYSPNAEPSAAVA
jgi:hypothetical protein